MLYCLFSFTTFYAKGGDSISIIPRPLTMQEHNGHFVLNNSTTVATSASDAAVSQTVEWFTNKIATSTGYHLSSKKSSKNEISL
ncbi:MAG TPA: glycoside hydrolase family 20 zincin-like fold domain-containing protein [Hanamia sp.]